MSQIDEIAMMDKSASAASQTAAATEKMPLWFGEEDRANAGGRPTLIGRIDDAAAMCAYALAWLASAMIVVLAVWVSYGAFVRYVLRTPDSFVTEGTALLLLPLAFLALPYAFHVSGFPAASGLVERLHPMARVVIGFLTNLFLATIGLFLSAMGISATWRAVTHGTRSMINEWPVAPFWALIALAATLFTIMALLRVIRGEKRL